MTDKYSAVGDFAGQLCENISINLKERTDDFRRGDGFETTVNSVLSTLLGRQCALALGLAESPLTWNGHIAPLVLRSMIDLLISYRWILVDPVPRANEYVSYGLGIEKLTTAHYQEKIESGYEEVDVQAIVDSNLNWIESQQFHIFVPINFGSWTGSSVRSMCDEISSSDLYKFAYTPFSACVHNTWNHVGKWNANMCNNLLHKRHMVGTIVDAWPIVDFINIAFKYLNMVIDEFDKYYDYVPVSDKPLVALELAMVKLEMAWCKAEARVSNTTGP